MACMPETLKILCPCCETLLFVDPSSGAILREERKKHREHATLDAALDNVRAQKKEAEEKLRRAMDENRHRDEILEKKFEEARKRAAADPTGRPPNPFDNE